MAKDRNDGIYVDRPKPDVYLALLIMTTAAMLIATVLLWIESNSLQ